MNGWQRLFTLLLVLATILYALAQWNAYPRTDADGQESVYSCALRYTYVSKTLAGLYLESGIPADHAYAPIEDPEAVAKCRADLSAVVTGKAYEARLDSWRSWAWEGYLLLLAGFGALYTLGAALGWVWRGFFPKRPSSPAN